MNAPEGQRALHWPHGAIAIDGRRGGHRVQMERAREGARAGNAARGRSALRFGGRTRRGGNGGGGGLCGAEVGWNRHPARPQSRQTGHTPIAPARKVEIENK